MSDMNGLAVFHLQEMYRLQRREHPIHGDAPLQAAEFRREPARPFRGIRQLANSAGSVARRIAGALVRPKAVAR